MVLQSCNCNLLYKIDSDGLNKNIKVSSYVPGLYIWSGKCIPRVVESWRECQPLI